jgi:hypothetical protein
VNRQRYYLELLEKLFMKKGTLVLGVANNGNNRKYRKFVESLGKLPKKYKVDMEFDSCFVCVRKGRKKIYFVKTDEIATDKGHVLIVGYPHDIRSKKLEDIFSKVKRRDCVVIANHPLHHLGIDYFFYSKLIGGNDKVSISRRELNKYKGKFDAIELNSYFPGDWDKIRAYSKKNKIPVVADSDAHEVDELFRSWFEIKNLDFRNPEKFKKSLKRGLKKGLKVHARAHGFEAKYVHVLHGLINKYGGKLGLVK